MAKEQKVFPFEGMETDTDEAIAKKAAYIKNLLDETNNNPGALVGEAANQYALTKLLQNAPYNNIPLPAGENHAIGYHYYKYKKQGFTFIWNSESNHSIYRVNGIDGTVTKVVQSPCLNFIYDPAHFISKGRCVLFLTTRFSTVTGFLEEVTYIVYTDYFNDIGFICVEDCIATGGFDASVHPYFAVNDPDCSMCNNLRLGVAKPSGCMEITPVARPKEGDEGYDEDKVKPNLLNYQGLQWRLRYIDVWGRESEYGDPSDLYINIQGGNCIANSAGLPRCVTLRFNAGCPTIDRVELLVRSNFGGTRGLATATDWYLAKTIKKYNDAPAGQSWFERTYADDIAYNAANNTMEVTFCNDSLKTPVDYRQTNRNQNPMPLAAGSVFPLNRRLGAARILRDFEPMPIEEIQKAVYTVTPPVPDTCGTTPLRKIKVYGLLYNPFDEQVTYLRKKDSSIVFGTADCYARPNNPFMYDQVLPKDQAGIVAYLAGTGHYALSKQNRYDRTTGSFEEMGLDFNDLGNGDRYIAVQVWEFSVIPGKYVLRLASHTKAPSDEGYEKTSTRLMGLSAIGKPGQLVRETKEVLVDVCDGDADLLTAPLMIYDLSNHGSHDSCTANRSSACEGYLFEDEKNKNPIELARVTGGEYGCNYTDHNGYYFRIDRSRGISAKLWGYKNCVANQLLAEGQTAHDNQFSLHKFDNLYAYKGESLYPQKDRYVVKGKITLCTDANIGIGGALVILSRGNFTYAGSDGSFSIAAHNIGDTTNARVETVIYSQRGTCQLTNCEDACSFCLPNATCTSPACSGTARVVTLATVGFNIRNFNKRGPHFGGRYGVGMVTEDWMGRVRYVQTDEKKYIEIPSLQKTKTYDYSTIQYDITNVNFDSSVRRVQFYLTENLNEEDYITISIDRIQLVDSTGNTNTSAPTAMRIYYQGLQEYIKQNNYSTNLAWQFITPSTGLPIVGDEVEFVANGDGTFYDENIRAQIQYDKEGKYIQIEYMDVLKDLTANAQVKIIRPKLSQQEQFYYSVCPSIRVVNGKAVVPTGAINLVDSYLLNRQFPVPVEVPVTKKDDAGNDIQTSETVNELRSYPFPFEHHSPSDFWGDHLWNKGRVSAHNPYEKQHGLPTGVDVSGVLSTIGSTNALSYFDTANETVFDEQEWGGITCVLVATRMALFIFEHDNAVIGFDDNRIYMNAQGQVVGNGGQIFGNPERKAGSNFGCQLPDINTIQERDGLVTFLDRARIAQVVHNYSSAEDISVPAGVKGWLASKIKYVTEQNRTTERQRFFLGGIDPKRGLYLFTDAYLHPGTADFINDLPDADHRLPETMAWHLEAKIAKGMLSFVPEMYGYMDGDRNDQQLITFRNGVPWYHYNALAAPATRFNNFYGTAVNWFITVIYNHETGTEPKVFRSTRVWMKELRVKIDYILTEKGQLSRLMPLWWQRVNKVWKGDFKCAINSRVDVNLPKETTPPNVLLDGDLLGGRWIKVRYTGAEAEKEQYMEITGVSGFADQA
jgi:hypothetical protein